MKYYGMGIIIFSLLIQVFWVDQTQAASLMFVQDEMSNHQLSEFSQHTFRFITPSGIHHPSHTIRIHFHADFHCEAISYQHISISHGPNTGSEYTHMIHASPGIHTWGVSFNQNVLTLSPPMNASANHISPNSKLIIRVGSETSAPCQNPSSKGSYIIGIDGGFQDSGFLAVPILDSHIGVTVDQTVLPELPQDSIIITAPKKTHIVFPGEILRIRWEMMDSLSLPDRPIMLYYSKDNGQTYYLIDGPLPHTKEYNWNVPVHESGFIHVRVQVMDVYDRVAFDITDHPIYLVKKEYIQGGDSAYYDEVLLKDQESRITEIPLPIPESDSHCFADNMSFAGHHEFSHLFTYDITFGDIMKTPISSTVYFYAPNGARYVFPSRPIYDTWFEDFDRLKYIEDDCLADIPLKGNVVVRAGTNLVKLTYDPKVYAVEPKGYLRHIISEEAAQSLYGANWNRRIMDVSDVFFMDYRFAEPLTGIWHAQGTLIKYKESPHVYYIQDGKKRRILNEQAFYDNLFQWKNIVEISDAYIYDDGPLITVAEVNLLHLYGV